MAHNEIGKDHLKVSRYMYAHFMIVIKLNCN